LVLKVSIRVMSDADRIGACRVNVERTFVGSQIKMTVAEKRGDVNRRMFGIKHCIDTDERTKLETLA